MKWTITATYEVEADSAEKAKMKFHAIRPSSVEVHLFVPTYKAVWSSAHGAIMHVPFPINVMGAHDYEAQIKAASPIVVQFVIRRIYPDANFKRIEGVIG